MYRRSYLSPKNVFIKAIKTNNYKKVIRMLDNGLVKLNIKEKWGQHDVHSTVPIVCAAYYARLKLFKILIRKGANIKYTESMLRQKLVMYAAEGGNLEVVKYLIEECDVDVNYTDLGDSTPLLYSVMNKKDNIQVVRYLINHGANIKQINIRGDTVIHLAIEFRNKRILRFLADYVPLSYFTKPNNDDIKPVDITFDGYPLLMLNYSLKIFYLLLNYGASFNQKITLIPELTNNIKLLKNILINYIENSENKIHHTNNIDSEINLHNIIYYHRILIKKLPIYRSQIKNDLTKGITGFRKIKLTWIILHNYRYTIHLIDILAEELWINISEIKKKDPTIYEYRATLLSLIGAKLIMHEKAKVPLI